VYDGILYQVKQRADNMDKSMKIRLMKALVWPVSMYD